MLEYKGYHGHVVFDEEAGYFHGEVLDLNDVITFQGSSVHEITNAFQESVEDYLAYCEERGEKPDKPFSGKLMLRIPIDLHRKVYVSAKKSGKSINEYITERLSEAV
jgi:predicted HicB family RNase H-like nuclease